jgi:hypothetical protein
MLAIAASILMAVGLAAPAAQVQKHLRAAAAKGPIVLDGIIDTEEWSGAAVADQFIQFEPQRGAPESRRTEALLLHDEATLYVAFRAEDDEPLTAQLTRRDADLFADDAVIVVLDTYFDRQSGYYFMANPLGTQTDGRIANDGRTSDADWDASWRVATQRTETSWTAEIAIPLSSLKYLAGDDVSWGINFGRSRRASLELSYWAGPLDNRFRVSQAGSVSELSVRPPAHRYQIVPYGQSVVQEGEKTDWNAGVDARYEITSTTTAFGTLNPDFALIEADQERVNLTRFELSLPEKRQFFIEGGELFRQRIRTFYSRRISDITAGGKVLGKEGPWTFAGIYSRATPSNEEGDADYGVARVQRDLGRSSVALMAAGRSFDGLSQGSVGLDATLFFTDTFGMTAQLAESYGAFGKGTLAYFVRPSYDSATGHFHVRFTHLGDHFQENVNPIGFVQDDDRRELDSALSKTFWPAASPFERIQYNSNYNIYWAASSSLLRSWQIDQTLDVDLRNRFSLGFDFTEEFKSFEKEFRNRDVGFAAGYNTREFESVTVGYRFGESFDSSFDLFTAAAAYKLTEELSVEYELQRLILTPDPEDETTWIHVVRSTQFFTPDLFLKLFFQTNSAIDRRNVQLTFVYRYQPPFGTLQFAYQRGTAEFGERSEQGNTFFVKVTTVF